MRQLTEIEAEDLLEKEGFEVVKREVAIRKEDLMDIAKKIPFPWAMKVSSVNIVHKAKRGGVATNIQNIIQADVKFDEFSRLQGDPGSMVQKMVSGYEVIIGIKKTPEFGHTIMFGKGGGNVENDKDVSFRVIPASKKEVQEMIKETRCYSELKKNKIDINKIERVMEKIQKLIFKYPDITELDINPLFVNNKKTIVADARISFG